MLSCSRKSGSISRNLIEQGSVKLAGLCCGTKIKSGPNGRWKHLSIRTKYPGILLLSRELNTSG